jgi:hypothetical protein
MWRANMRKQVTLFLESGGDTDVDLGSLMVFLIGQMEEFNKTSNDTTQAVSSIYKRKQNSSFSLLC